MKRLLISTIIIFIIAFTLHAKGEKDEKHNDKPIMLYPKLTEGIVYVDGLNDDKVVTLINSSGDTFEIKQTTFTGYKVLDIREFPDGVYEVKIDHQQNNISMKIVKH